MRIVYSLGAAAFLAACSMSSTPPGGTCATRASVDLNALQAAIQIAETNLGLGYSIAQRAVAGSTEIQNIKVPINGAKERQSLAAMQARLGDVQAQTDIALAQCSGS